MDNEETRPPTPTDQGREENPATLATTVGGTPDITVTPDLNEQRREENPAPVQPVGKELGV